MKVVLANTQQNQGFEDNMSNLTTEATSASPTPIPAAKKKRSLPGNPDPDAEVVALSPGSLMATNRFMCEVCHKGFQREQNLQLHRRGHNLPWKLKQRSSNDVVPRKKVYVCPEGSCVHHHPSRALGDLTGIKKHFSRKHGEKKYKCDKCSKKYAVQSDWKAHSKTCGTREYKCDCGTIFSRRDSFITHRAFCDALAEESAKAIPQSNPYPLLFDQQHFSSITPEMIPSSTWLPTPTSIDHTTTEQMYSHKIENPSPLPLQLASYQANSASPHLSATALLQKAAQMGATMSRQADHHNGQMAAHSTSNNTGFSHGSTTTTTTTPPHTLQEVMMMASLSYDERECGLGMAGSTSKRDQDFVTTTTSAKEGGGDGLTRDFLGPRAFSHMDILTMAAVGLPNCMTTTTSSSFQQCQQNNSKPWHDMRSYHHEKYDVSSEFHI